MTIFAPLSYMSDKSEAARFKPSMSKFVGMEPTSRSVGTIGWAADIQGGKAGAMAESRSVDEGEGPGICCCCCCCCGMEEALDMDAGGVPVEEAESWKKGWG